MSKPATFYKSYLDDMFARGVDAEVSNAEEDHAAYALGKMLGSASESVRIFPAAIDEFRKSGVYNSPEVLAAAQSLLLKEGVKVVLVTPDAMARKEVEAVPFVQSMTDMANKGTMAGTMEIRSASPNAIDFLKQNHFCHPMVVVDESAYRIERPGETEEAYVNFGNAKDARRLAGLFDDVLYTAGTELIAVGGK